MFGIEAGELFFILVLAVILFGPDKIPGYARKFARVLAKVREVANNATTSIKKELGPEYQDLTIEDLNPKTFVQKHLLKDIQDELDEMKASFDDVKGVLESTKTESESLSQELKRTVDTASKNLDAVQAKVNSAQKSADLVAVGRVPFDDEAT